MKLISSWNYSVVFNVIQQDVFMLKELLIVFVTSRSTHFTSTFNV